MVRFTNTCIGLAPHEWVVFEPIFTAVSSVTIGFVIRLNKPNYGIDKYGVQ